MGRKISERWKIQGHPKGMLGKKWSDKTRKLKEGSRWMHKDNENALVHKKDIDSYIDNGYTFGRIKLSNSKTNKGCKKMIKNEESIYVRKEDIQKYLDNGWSFAYIKK